MIVCRFVSFLLVLLVAEISRVDAFGYDVETFVIDPIGGLDREGRGVSVVYGCSVANRVGPCVDTSDLCTSQGGDIVGYCFVEGQYQGVCCPGLNPASAVLTTKRPESVVHDDTTTTTTTTTTRRPFPGFPTLPTPTTQQENRTAPTFPSFNFTTTTQNPNRTQPTFPSFNFTTTTENPNRTQPTFPSFNFTTTTENPNRTQPTFPSFNFTTTTQNPNRTLPTFPSFNFTTTTTTTATTEAPSSEDTSSTEPATEQPEESSPTDETTTEATPSEEITLDSSPSEETTQPVPPEEPTTEPPTALDVAESPNQCGLITSEIQSYFTNPSYPNLDSHSDVHEFSIMPQEGYCGLRIHFLETRLARKTKDGCSSDSVAILNEADSPLTPLCGRLDGYEVNVSTAPEQPVKIAITTQSHAYLWKIKLTQVGCSILRTKHRKQGPGGFRQRQRINKYYY